jgi:hypothetical protein
MPVIDDFARAQAMPAVRPPTSELIASARLARAAALRHWISAAWRLVAKRR